MNTHKVVPEWISRHSDSMKVALGSKKFNNYKEFCKLYRQFNNYINLLPSTTSILLPTEHKPSFSLIEALFSHFSFTYLYKLRSLQKVLDYSLKEGNFISSVILVRSLLETIACQWYFLHRILGQFKEYVKLLENTKANTKEASVKQGELMGQVYDLLIRANAGQGKGFSWSEYLGRSFEMPKSVHVQTAIQDLEKKSKHQLSSYYAILSEMTHPNFGSHTLTVLTKEQDSSSEYQLVLGDQKHLESAFWFFDHLSLPLRSILNLGITSIDKTNELKKFLEVCSNEENK